MENENSLPDQYRVPGETPGQDPAQPNVENIGHEARRPLDDIPNPTSNASQRGEPTDDIDEQSMESFPASDAPSFQP